MFDRNKAFSVVEATNLCRRLIFKSRLIVEPQPNVNNVQQIGGAIRLTVCGRSELRSSCLGLSRGWAFKEGHFTHDPAKTVAARTEKQLQQINIKIDKKKYKKKTITYPRSVWPIHKWQNMAKTITKMRRAQQKQSGSETYSYQK